MKIPKGATHHYYNYRYFFKKDGDVWYNWSSRGGTWMEDSMIPEVPSALIPIPLEVIMEDFINGELHS